ncbi:hypothetical protein niasHS_001187 [Heterodera schachtii]|uniref:B30.2/SPRY domain-containing protein n=1 Tax=Heterodera schachtii TaxID=97005 RepID=A0ABD2KCJ5_HETSC
MWAKIQIINRATDDADGATFYWDRKRYTRKQLQANMVVSFGGMVAERMLFGQSIGHTGGDLPEWKSIAEKLVRQSKAWRQIPAGHRTPARFANMKRRCIKAAHAKAVAVLTRYFKEMEKVAIELYHKRVVYRPFMRKVFGGPPESERIALENANVFNAGGHADNGDEGPEDDTGAGRLLQAELSKQKLTMEQILLLYSKLAKMEKEKYGWQPSTNPSHVYLYIYLLQEFRSVFAKYSIRYAAAEFFNTFYYEISVVNMKSTVFFGFAVKQPTPLGEIIQDRTGTYTFSSYGNFCVNGSRKGDDNPQQKEGMRAAATFSVGDVVRIGIDFGTRQIFFTKNGQLLG